MSALTENPDYLSRCPWEWVLQERSSGLQGRPRQTSCSTQQSALTLDFSTAPSGSNSLTHKRTVNTQADGQGQRLICSSNRWCTLGRCSLQYKFICGDRVCCELLSFGDVCPHSKILKMFIYYLFIIILLSTAMSHSKIMTWLLKTLLCAVSLRNNFLLTELHCFTTQKETHIYWMDERLVLVTSGM